MTNIREMIQVLKESGACEESLEWLSTLNPEAPAQEAWDACPDAGWMVWLAISGDRVLYDRAREGSFPPGPWVRRYASEEAFAAYYKAKVDGVRKAVTFSEVWAAHLEGQIRAV